MSEDMNTWEHLKGSRIVDASEKDAEIDQLKEDLISVIRGRQKDRVLIADMLRWMLNVPYRGELKNNLMERAREATR